MNKRIVNTVTTRRANQRLVLDIIRHNGPVSVAIIAKSLNVPAATIARVTNGLMEAKLIRVAPNNIKKKVGKPPILLEINEKFATLVGVELNELVIRILITDFKGNILAEYTERTTRSSEKILSEQLPEIIQKTINSCGNNLPPVKWIGIGIQGLLTVGANTVSQGFLPHETDVSLSISKEFNIPVFVDNDANLAVMAECTFGAGKNCKHVISLLDRGWIGAGFIIDGKLYAGKNNGAGELTAGIHSQEPTETDMMISEFPFIESYGLERMIRETGFNDYNDEDFTSRSQLINFIANLAKNGNKKAALLIKNEAKMFAIAIIRLMNFLDPELIVLQGDITAAKDIIEKQIKSNIELLDKKYQRSIPMPELKFSYLNQNPVTLGAISQCIDKLTNNVI